MKKPISLTDFAEIGAVFGAVCSGLAINHGAPNIPNLIGHWILDHLQLVLVSPSLTGWVLLLLTAAILGAIIGIWIGRIGEVDAAISAERRSANLKAKLDKKAQRQTPQKPDLRKIYR